MDIRHCSHIHARCKPSGWMDPEIADDTRCEDNNCTSVLDGGLNSSISNACIVG